MALESVARPRLAYLLDALIIGYSRCWPFSPVRSRSGSTIPGGMLRNFDRPSARALPSWMAAPIMLAAGGYESLSVLKSHILHTILAPLRRWVCGGRHHRLAFHPLVD